MKTTLNFQSLNQKHRNMTSLKDRPLIKQEINSLSISKRSEKIDNFYQFHNNSQEKDPLPSEQRIFGGFSSSSIKQNLQMKALKSLIKNKYGNIPNNFLTILKSLDKKDERKSINFNDQSLQNPLKLLDLLYKHPDIFDKKNNKNIIQHKKTSNSHKNQTKNNTVNKSYDSNIKQKFVDLEKSKVHILQNSSNRNRLENSNNNSKQNLHYITDIRQKESEQKNDSDSKLSNKKNLLPDSDLEEILDKFYSMENIVNYKGFLQSMKFIMNEITGRFPKATSFLNKLQSCYEKLLNILFEKLENKENTEQKQVEYNKNIINIQKEMNVKYEKACQTQKNIGYEVELDTLQKEKSDLESQNNRLILIITNLHRRGIDVEKLFEKQMEILLNPKHKLSFSEIKKFHIDSEESNETNRKEKQEENHLKQEENYLKQEENYLKQEENHLNHEKNHSKEKNQKICNQTDFNHNLEKIRNSNERLFDQRNLIESPKNTSTQKKLQNGFKLDLSKVNNNGPGNIKNKEEVVGFHQEFMSKINEFSQSWRDAAMNERKLPG